MTALIYQSWKEKSCYLGTEYDFVNGNVVGSYSYVPNKIYGNNISISHKPSRKGVYLSGGPWTMNRRTDSRDTDWCTVFRPGYSHPAYEGGFRATGTATPAFVWDETFESTHDDLFYEGSKAIAQLRPDMPDWSMVLSVAELRETLVPLKRKAKNYLWDYLKFRRNRRKKGPLSAKQVAEQWVSLNFGWIPFVSDMLSFLEAYVERDKRYHQMMRDNGRWVRRERYMLLEKTSSETTKSTHSGSWNPNITPTLVTQCYGGPKATTQYHSNSSTNAWCMGKAKYLLPKAGKGPGYGYRKMIIRKQLGGQLTPDQLYNIIPWSWLFDYFTGLGDFLTAIAPGIAEKHWFDYAYIMRTKESSTVGTFTQNVRDTTGTGSSQLVTVHAGRHYTSKARVVASPFGFGLETPSLKQISILGALGYSKYVGPS